MLRIAARFADQWDTFAEMPGTATDGVTSDLAERVQALDAACRSVGRDPARIRRSTWAPAAALASEATYRDFVARHVAMGFTDLTTVLPARGDWPTVRHIAETVIPELRAGSASA
jgi:hypothetical protein